jgi:uncharacterized protein YndB with AHSA1/START domain
MSTAAPPRANFTMTRMYDASIEDCWKLWTTAAGIESWWGPEGFSVVVTDLNLQVGGELNYVMTATAPQQVAFMKQAGMPLATPCKVTFTEIQPPRKLGFSTLTDFVPGVKPYQAGTLVEMEPTLQGTKITLTFDAMHDAVWTGRARAGHESQLRKLDAVMTARGKRVHAP